METVRHLAAISVLGLAFISRSGAEPDSSQKQATPSAASVNCSESQTSAANPDSDWLLRSYELQLQNRRSAGGGQGPDLFYQISSDKDLARVAGVSLLEASPSPQELGLMFRTRNVSHDASVLRADSSTAPSAPVPNPGAFKPLMTPLEDFPGTSLAPVTPDSKLDVPAQPKPVPPIPVQPSATSPDVDDSGESSAMQTPGQVAAESDPLWNKNSTGLTLELPPNEPVQANPIEDQTAKVGTRSKDSRLAKQAKPSGAPLVGKTAAEPPPRASQIRMPAFPATGVWPQRAPAFPMTNPFMGGH